MAWKKIERGLYYLPGTRYAVQSDGYEPGQHIGADAYYGGFVGGEWAAVRYPNVDDALKLNADGDNLNWYPTRREAKEAIERIVRVERLH